MNDLLDQALSSPNFPKSPQLWAFTREQVEFLMHHAYNRGFADGVATTVKELG